MNQGEFLQDARARARQTQKWVAEQALVAERTVMRAEKDQQVSRENLIAICSVLGIDPSVVPPRAGSIVDDPTHTTDAETLPEPVRLRRMPSWLPRMFVPANLAAALMFGWFWTSSFPYGDAFTRLYPDLANIHFEMHAIQGIGQNIGRLGDEMLNDPAKIDVLGLDARMRRMDLLTDCTVYVTYLCATNMSRLVRSDDGIVEIRLGPSGADTMFANILKHLPRSSELVVEAATTSTSEPPPAGWLWFDPRGLSADQIPGDEPGHFLHLRLRKEPAR